MSSRNISLVIRTGLTCSMCGRYSLITLPDAIYRKFHVSVPASFRPRYNISPTQEILVVRQGEHGHESAMIRWGIIPLWAWDEQANYSTINIPAETIKTSSLFGTTFKYRRCLIPASGFYEWQQNDQSKQSYNVHMKDAGIFALAGLWDVWEGQKGNIIECCAIIVTEANTLLRPIHHRMPVIIDDVNYENWLNPNTTDNKSLLRPYSSAKMAIYPVSTKITSSKIIHQAH